MPYSYGKLIRILNNCTGHAMTSALASVELTAAQGHIMGYIFHRADAPCARDIEDAFQLSHPTVSGILSRLEQKGFIEMRPDAQDRRCKRIYALEKGSQLHETMHRTIRENEEKMVQNFSEEEKELFRSLLLKAIDNFDGGQCKKRHKEESK